MLHRTRILTFFALASMSISALSFPIAQAQGTPTQPASGTAPGGPNQTTASTGGGARTDASVGLQRPVNLTPEEIRKAGDTHVGRIALATSAVRKMLEQARSQRDVVKTLCLNERLTQLDVTLRSAKERRSALEAAFARHDNELLAHEFTILNVYRQRSDRLSAEANQCVGNEVGFIGETRVTTTIDPTIPDNSTATTTTINSPTTGTSPPPPSCASCST